MSKIKIAVLDSGINRSHPRFREMNFVRSVSFTGKETPATVVGHGTNVCDRIRQTLVKHADMEEFEFYDCQVFDDPENIVEGPILEALRYCIEEKVDIINLSIGIISVISPPQELYSICDQACNQGIAIVAAGDNFGDRSYPADFKFVCGVSAGVIETPGEYGYDPHRNHFIGKGDLQRLADLEDRHVFRTGTSYATGYITGLLALYLKDNPGKFRTVGDLMESFRKSAWPEIRVINSEKGLKSFTRMSVVSKTEKDRILSAYFPGDKFSWMQKVAIYPYSNKEFGSLKYNPDQFRFEITELFDFPRSLLEGKTAVIGDRPYNLKIDVNHLIGDFDTCVIGYPEDVGSAVNVRYYTDLLKYISENGKNVFCFDPRVHREVTRYMEKYESAGTVYCPGITEDDSPGLSSLMSLGKVTKPVLAVVGTSSRNGKFSIQLRIRKILGRQGYKVGWLSTEPQGELYGADFVFPYGYSSSVSAPVNQWPAILAGAVKAIEVTRQPDIILSGHQAGIIGGGSTSLINTAFMEGIRADAAVVSISPNDDYSYIERVVNTLKYYYDVPVLFFVLNELKRQAVKDKEGNVTVTEQIMEADSWRECANRINDRFHLPVLNAFDSRYDQQFLNHITDFYS